MDGRTAEGERDIAQLPWVHRLVAVGEIAGLDHRTASGSSSYDVSALPSLVVTGSAGPAQDGQQAKCG